MTQEELAIYDTIRDLEGEYRLTFGHSIPAEVAFINIEPTDMIKYLRQAIAKQDESIWATLTAPVPAEAYI